MVRRTPQTLPQPSPADELAQPTRAFYLGALDVLDRAGRPYCVAGAYALAAHAGIIRHTKDLDIFLKRDDMNRALAAYEAAGCRTERTHPHWLAKAFAPPPVDAFVDLIFRAASGMWEVDDEWLKHARLGEVAGRKAPLCPAEELIWSKAMVMERHRFDGADIAHILHSTGPRLDWERLTRRAFGHEGILLGHLAFYRYIYPREADYVPVRVMEELLRRLREQSKPDAPVCRGTMLSWEQYLPDVKKHGLIDGRLKPYGRLSQQEIDQWTNADK
jgi:hypothetical protein